MKPTPGQSPQAFWDDRYRDASDQTSGLPSALLERFATGRAPGCALDLGCAKGDDAIWLAQKGWEVCAVDIAQPALDIGRANAVRCDVEDRISFERHDLTETFPTGEFDLISAMFLQTPFDFPRRKVFERAHDRLRPTNLLRGGERLLLPSKVSTLRLKPARHHFKIFNETGATLFTKPTENSSAVFYVLRSYPINHGLAVCRQRHCNGAFIC